MAKQKLVNNCPSCGEETYAGKYCIMCGAVMEGQSARPSDDVLDEIADEVLRRVLEQAKKLSMGDGVAENGTKKKPESEPVEPVKLTAKHRGIF